MRGWLARDAEILESDAPIGDDPNGRSTRDFAARFHVMPTRSVLPFCGITSCRSASEPDRRTEGEEFRTLAITSSPRPTGAIVVTSAVVADPSVAHASVRRLLRESVRRKARTLGANGSWMHRHRSVVDVRGQR
jgi:hypothetical protein